MKTKDVFLPLALVLAPVVVWGSVQERAHPQVILTVQPLQADGSLRLVGVAGEKGQAQFCAWDPRYPVETGDTLIIKLSPVGRDPIWGEIREGNRLLGHFTTTDKKWEVRVSAGELAGDAGSLVLWGTAHFGRGRDNSEPVAQVTVQVVPELQAPSSPPAVSPQVFARIKRELEALKQENQRLQQGGDRAELGRLRAQVMALEKECVSLRAKAQGLQKQVSDLLTANADLKQKLSAATEATPGERRGVVVILGAPHVRRTLYVWRGESGTPNRVITRLNAQGVGCVMDIALPATVGLGGGSPTFNLTTGHPAVVMGERR